MTRGGWFVGESHSTLRYHRAGRVSKLWWLVRRSGGFRMVQLNVVGWSALLAPPALLGALIARLCRRSPVRGSAVGAIAAWAVALVVDSVHWRASPVTFDRPEMSRPVLDRLVDSLREDGVDVAIELDEMESLPDHPVWQIRSQMRHRRLLERRLAELVQSCS